MHFTGTVRLHQHVPFSVFFSVSKIGALLSGQTAVIAALAQVIKSSIFFLAEYEYSPILICLQKHRSSNCIPNEKSHPKNVLKRQILKDSIAINSHHIQS